MRPWLGHLALHLNRLGTHDIAWWRFGTSSKVTGTAVGVAVGVADLVLEDRSGRRGVARHAVRVMIGLVTGVLFGVAHWYGSTPLEPVRTRLRLRGRAGKRVWSRGLLGLAFGGAVGGAYGLVRAMAYWLVTPDLEMTAGVLVDVGVFAWCSDSAPGRCSPWSPRWSHRWTCVRLAVPTACSGPTGGRCSDWWR